MAKVKNLLWVLLLSLVSCEITPTFTPDQDMLTMINEARGKEQPVHWDNTFQAAAEMQAKYMDSTKYYAHKWEDGTTFEDRLRMVGFETELAGENIAWGHLTESSVLDGWMNSPPHRDAIMWPYYNAVGVARSGVYWCMVIGYIHIK